MIVDVVMPKMGESLQEGTIIKWLKSVGDRVERDEMILEISTDKVDTEIPSPVAGVITKIIGQENETIEVGKVIAQIETEATEVVQPAESTATESTAAEANKPEVNYEPESESEFKPEKIADLTTVATDFEGGLVGVVMPKMGESLQEGTIIKWLKSVGDRVERDEMILEISTDKVDTEVPSPTSGILIEILASENETVEVGKVIARIAVSDGVPAKQPPASAQPTTDMPQKKPASKPADEKHPALPAIAAQQLPQRMADGKRFYSPLVREIAKEHIIPISELDTVAGTGLDERVTKQDLLSYIEKRKSMPAGRQLQPDPSKATTVTVTTQPKPAIDWGDDVEIIPMDRIRQLIAEHMVYSKQTSPHVTSVAEADVSGMVRFREKNKNKFEALNGYKLTYTPFFALATVEAIRAYPMVNVSVDGKNIIRHKSVNLGFATTLPDGNLIVPVIKKADSLNLTGLAQAVYDLSTRARVKKLNPDDIQGGTITITNFGTFGTLFGTPIINQPHAAIMGIGSISKRPVVRVCAGEYLVVARDMAFVSITYDHRVIDGMLAGLCLSAFVASLEKMSEETLTI